MEFINACLEANKELCDYISNELTVDDFIYGEKTGEGGDRSSKIDLIAESIFKKHLLQFGDIYSEESGLIKSPHLSQFAHDSSLIILDPLDGSDNFISGLNYYGTSVSLTQNNKAIISIVYDLCTNEYFIKNKDEYISNSRSFSKPNIAVFERSYKFPEICEKLYEKGIKYRSPGAVALSLANARNYKFVLFGGDMREFDLKAAMHICDDLYSFQNNKFLLVSKNKIYFDEIKDIINQF